LSGGLDVTRQLHSSSLESKALSVSWGRDIGVCVCVCVCVCACLSVYLSVCLSVFLYKPQTESDFQPAFKIYNFSYLFCHFKSIELLKISVWIKKTN